MTQGEVETLKQTGADRQSQFLQALGTAAHTVDELLETALLRLLDYLAVDQRRRALLERCLFALDEAPHLIELYLGHGQVPEQVRIDLFSLVRGALEPRQHRFFRHTQNKGDPCQINLDQEHLERHHHLLFRGLQIKEDSIPRLGKGGAAFGALEDASLPALRQIGRDRTDVPAVYQLSIRASGMRARLAPGLGCSHGQSSSQ